MNIKKFVESLAFATTHDIDASDLIILYDVGTEPDGEATIMKIVKKPGAMSKATRHERVKRLCARGFLVKKEVPNNMRKKTLELSDTCMDFLKQFEGVGA
jgi:DNA-binding HxlR family transcriptional regulator